jgi:poly(hydroxyalkanoate) granule-associated protein
MTAQTNTQDNGTTAVEDQKPFELKNLPDEITGRAREIWLAGLGALSRLEEEGDKVFSDLVERGQNYESKRRKQIEDVTSGLREQQEAFTQDVTERLDNATQSVEKAVSDTLSGTLGRIGVPTRTEVRGLSRKVGELSKKLDALSQMLEAQKGDVEDAVYHVVPHDEGWAVTLEGAQPAVSVHDTKKEATTAAREEAKANVPSQLIIHKQDRSVQDTFTYTDEDDA